MTQALGTVIVSLDAFPALFRYPNGDTIDSVRVTIADYGSGQILQVWRKGPDNTAEEIFNRPVQSIEGASFNSGIAILSYDGTSFTSRSGGCGCGSQLAYVDLWPGLARVNTSLF